MGNAYDLAALAADFRSWHIWRGRSHSGAEAEWHATGRRRGSRKPERVTAADAEALRALLVQYEALTAVPA